MKNTAFLINTSRGQLVNEHDLAKALNEERIAGAGLDVLRVEPPPPDNPLLNAKNCLITPHIAWATKSARKRLMKVVIENIVTFLNKKPQNIVNL
jgi:glycerate dehydrogenase